MNPIVNLSSGLCIFNTQKKIINTGIFIVIVQEFFKKRINIKHGKFRQAEKETTDTNIRR